MVQSETSIVYYELNTGVRMHALVYYKVLTNVLLIDHYLKHLVKKQIISSISKSMVSVKEEKQ